MLLLVGHYCFATMGQPKPTQTVPRTKHRNCTPICKGGITRKGPKAAARELPHLEGGFTKTDVRGVCVCVCARACVPAGVDGQVGGRELPVQRLFRAVECPAAEVR